MIKLLLSFLCNTLKVVLFVCTDIARFKYNILIPLGNKKDYCFFDKYDSQKKATAASALKKEITFYLRRGLKQMVSL